MFIVYNMIITPKETHKMDIKNKLFIQEKIGEVTLFFLTVSHPKKKLNLN